MPVVVMIGPHAVGKTTAAKRWKTRYGEGIQDWSIDRLRGKTQYHDNAAKARLVKECRQSPIVNVIESARGFAVLLDSLIPEDPEVIALTCDQSAARIWWAERRKGKSLSDYWTDNRLQYECVDYAVNALQKRGIRYKHFDVVDREASWVEVDAYFSKIYRRLHNELMWKRNKAEV